METLSKAVPRERRDYRMHHTPCGYLEHITHHKHQPLCPTRPPLSFFTGTVSQNGPQNRLTGFCDKNWGQCAWYVEIWRPQPYPYLLGRTRQGARARALDGAQVEPLEFVWLESRVRVGIWERATLQSDARISCSSNKFKP